MRFALCSSALALCLWHSLAAAFYPSRVLLSCGENVGTHVCLRVRQLLHSVADVRDFEDVSAPWTACVMLVVSLYCCC